MQGLLWRRRKRPTANARAASEFHLDASCQGKIGVLRIPDGQLGRGERDAWLFQRQTKPGEGVNRQCSPTMSPGIGTSP